MLFGFLSRLFKKDLNTDFQLPEKYRELESILSCRFKNPSLLIQALTHRSFTSKEHDSRTASNERLEFLGDSVLNLIAGKYFFENFEESQEGELTRMRSYVVSGENLSAKARAIGLGKYVILGEFEQKAGGSDKDSILEDCMEALIGAVYLDGGIEKAERAVKKIILPKDPEQFSEMKSTNFKSELLELVQSKGMLPPRYETVNTEGPEHEKTFTVNVLVGGKAVAQGVSGSKKKAEQEASSRALDLIRSDKTFFDSDDEK